MNKFFLLVIAIGVAALIGAFVFAAFTLEAPFRNRHELLRAAPTSERTLTPLPESGGAIGSPAGHHWPGVGYPAISANRGDGRRLLSFEADSNSAANRNLRRRVSSTCGTASRNMRV
jgi:hypothetical protein